MAIWGSRVVAVDEDPETLEQIRTILRGHGAQLVAVSTPGEALTTVLGVMPDVLLVEVRTSGEDGLALIRKVRTLSPEKGGRIPAAVMTASAAPPEQVEEWRRAGFQRHLAKPFSAEDLLAIVDALSGRVVERRTSALAPAVGPGQPRRERRRERRDGIAC